MFQFCQSWRFAPLRPREKMNRGCDLTLPSLLTLPASWQPDNRLGPCLLIRLICLTFVQSPGCRMLLQVKNPWCKSNMKWFVTNRMASIWARGSPAPGPCPSKVECFTLTSVALTLLVTFKTQTGYQRSLVTICCTTCQNTVHKSCDLMIQFHPLPNITFKILRKPAVG